MQSIPEPVDIDGDFVASWLRLHVKKPMPGRILRWLGEPAEFDYRIGRPMSVPVDFIVRQRLFSVSGEPGLLPYPALPSRSWGIFALDGNELYLLEPGTASLSALLQREGRSLDEGEAGDLARLFSLTVLKGRDATGHAVVTSADAIREFGTFPIDGYRVDEDALRAVAGDVTPPTLDRTADGWRLTFVTLAGWMHEQDELGVEVFDIARDFSVVRRDRRILHSRIFTEMPSVRY